MSLFFCEKPYVAVVAGNRDQRAQICWNCFCQAKTLVCSQCKTASYCGKSCQTNDWMAGLHSNECRHYRQIGQSSTKILQEHYIELRLVARMLLRCRRDGGEPLEELLTDFPNGIGRRCLDDLQEKQAENGVDWDELEKESKSKWTIFSTIYCQTKPFTAVTEQEFRPMFRIASVHWHPILAYDAYSGVFYCGKGSLYRCCFCACRERALVCVCVSVCVSVRLSVRSKSRQRSNGL